MTNMINRLIFVKNHRMKNPAIKTITILLLLTISLISLITSCKKADNPNIIYTTFNKTLTGVPGSNAIDSIDLNLDTQTDIRFGIALTVTGDTLACQMTGGTTLSTGIYIDSTIILSSAYQIKPLNKNEVPSKYTPGVNQWATYCFVVLKRGSIITGIAGLGNKFIPVFVFNTITSKFHYGWIRINISSDHKTFKLIDGAYNLIPDVPLKMGEQ